MTWSRIWQEEGNGNSLQYSCLENPMERGAWWAAAIGSHRVGHDWSDLAAAGHVNPLQYSCWESPIDRGTWQTRVTKVEHNWSNLVHTHMEKNVQTYVYTLVCVCVCSVMTSSLQTHGPGSCVHEIFQGRILEQVAISFSRGSPWHRDQTRISCTSCIGRILYHCAT